MTRPFFAIALVLAVPAAASGAAPPEPQLSLGQETALQCSALFGVIAGEQARRVAGANAWPPLGQLGRGYFVRSAARVMDETGMNRDQVATLLKARAAQWQRQFAADSDPVAARRAALKPCLVLLGQDKR